MRLETTRGDGLVTIATEFNEERRRWDTWVIWKHGEPGEFKGTVLEGPFWFVDEEEAADEGLTSLQAVHDADVRFFDEELAKLTGAGG